MAISEQWASYREDDVGKAQKVKDMILSDLRWDKVDYIHQRCVSPPLWYVCVYIYIYIRNCEYMLNYCCI